MATEKRIEVVEMPISSLKDEIGNPRTITKRGKEELRESLENLGDFGIIVIDHENNIISGHQRVSQLKEISGEQTIVLCKRLIGYSKAELKAINIKANTHSGEWDLDKLAEWTADLQIKLGDLKLPQSNPMQDVKLKDMELIHYEKYDYVLIACKNEVDYLNLIRTLGIEDMKVPICKKKDGGQRKIKARAIWYHEMNADIVPKESIDKENATSLSPHEE